MTFDPHAHDGAWPARSIDSATTKDSALAKVRNGKESDAPHTNDANSEAERKQPKTFPVEYVFDIKLQPQTWLYQGIVPSGRNFEGKNVGKVGMLYGPPGSGKSKLAVELLVSAAMGLDFLNRQARRTCGGLYVASEDPDGIKGGIKGCMSVKGCTADLPLGVISNAPDLFAGEDLSPLICAIKAQADEMKKRRATLDIIALDTLRDSAGNAEENSSRDMSAVMRAVRTIATQTGAFVLVIHHSPKSGAGPRGSTAIPGALDTSFALNLIEPEEGSSDPIRRELVLAKQRHAADVNSDHSLRWDYRLKPVELDVRDEDGALETTAVVEFTECESRKAKRPKLNANETAVWDAIIAAESNGRGQTPPAAALAPKWAIALHKDVVLEVATSFGLAGDSISDPVGAQRKAFYRARVNLRKNRMIEVHNDWLWRVQR